MTTIRQQLDEDIKTSMRAKDKPRTGTLRLISAALKQKEIDERIELTDEHCIVILDKLAKQHRDSIEQFSQAKRTDLVDQEQFELEIINQYLPKPLSEAELKELISETIIQTKAESIRDMGKVMGVLKPKLQGKADMAEVSNIVKSSLN